MPLIELVPPITLPRGQVLVRPPSVGSASTGYIQSNFGLPMALM